MFIQLIGGLGNQLFQIAAGYAVCKRTGSVDTLQISSVSIDGRPSYFTTFLARCATYVQKGPLHNLTSVWKEPYFHYHEIPPTADVIRGYFQSSKYFADISGEIRTLFTPASSVQEAVQSRHASLLTDDMKRRGVVVHVRRSDYLTVANRPIHYVATDTYYAQAVKTACNRVSDAQLLVFSDDLEWCRAQKFFPKGTLFIDEPTDTVALHLMSQFRHYVISNSSFSWWATWLGEPAITVIAPDRWFGTKGPRDWEDVYEPSWIRIPVS